LGTDRTGHPDMTAFISFSIPGVAVGKGRPRISTRGGFARAYTPAPTVVYEAQVAAAGKQAMADAGLELLETPLNVRIDVFVQIPKSFSKKKREQALTAEIFPGRPDIDNVAKAILDALNGVAYKDDDQVVNLSVSKRYAIDPFVSVRISEVLA
jgi:Holliday junction resolvase RusA-like endonuclease